MSNIFDAIFRWKPVPSKEFERRVFSFLARRISDGQVVKKELEDADNLFSSTMPEEHREKRAEQLYFILERHILEQPKNKISAETLREHIRRSCDPEHAAGDFALLFFPSHKRQMKLFERFAESVLRRASELLEGGDRAEMLRVLGSDGRLAGFVSDKGFIWNALYRKIRGLSPADQVTVMQQMLKQAVEIIAKNVGASAGELRTELMLKGAYQELRDALGFTEDVPKVLLLVPQELLEEERIALMGKSELEEQLVRKQRVLESTVAELHGEKAKLSSLSREELEKRVEERTAALAKALEDVKANREKLEEAKEKDEAFLENINEGLMAVDPAWRILLWNKAATAISGWSKEEIVGKSLRSSIKFTREDNGAEFLDDSMILGKTRKTQGDAILIRKDGNKIVVRVGISPIFSEKGKVTSTVIVFRDISNERELQKTREEFGSLATHELRTPVAVIKGYVNLLAAGSVGPLTEKQKEYIEQVRRSNERLLDLINAMLNVSRIELGTLAIEPTPMYLPDIANGVLSELSPQIKSKKLSIKTDYDSYLPIMDVDQSLMHAVFQNLISNAVKYTPEGGKIGVSIERQKKEADVFVKISDSGYGIPKAQQDKIFSRLFRADNARAKVPEGTGLGLYIVKSILERCDGKIWFESVENKGTTFFFTIPLEGMKSKEGIKGLS